MYNTELQCVWSEKVGTRNTGQHSLCTVTAQAGCTSAVDDRSVERSICVTCHSVCVGTNHRKLEVQTAILGALCTCLDECASSTLSSQANSHYDIAERLLKTSAPLWHTVPPQATKYEYKYSRRLSTLSSCSSSASNFATCGSRDLRTGQPRDKRSFRGVSLGHLGSGIRWNFHGCSFRFLKLEHG